MRLLLKACCCLLILAGMAIAQTDRGTITGTISDPAGAVAPGAAIKAKNIGTGAEYTQPQPIRATTRSHSCPGHLR
jgi:hypothetical protein